jgi:hypothetical protein
MATGASSEHRAMGWAAIGGALSAIGGAVGVALAVWGATTHLWNDDYFLAGFVIACFITALGIYVLLAEFIGGIGPIKFPLPRTRLEREIAKDQPKQEDGAHPAKGSERRNVDLLRDHYKKGKGLLAAPDSLGGPVPASRFEAQQARAKKRDAIQKWVVDTYAMLCEHFPSHEDRFCPYADRWGHADAPETAREELDDARSPDAYLEEKLTVLAGLLKERAS